MASATQQIIQGLQHVPEQVTTALSDLRALDNETFSLAMSTYQEGKKVLETLDNPENDLDCSEKISEIIGNWESVNSRMNTHIKKSTGLYTILDDSINSLDLQIKSIQGIINDSIKIREIQTLSEMSSKKRKTEDIESFDYKLQEALEEADPNEPVYCYCRSVSSGQMVGCDNELCPVEWYHVECLGANYVPDEDPWYCPECKESMDLPKSVVKVTKSSGARSK